MLTHPAYQPGSLPGAFSLLNGGGKPNLGAGFTLRCFQRLSLPNTATQRCPWQDNWYTGGSFSQVLSYYGQLLLSFLRAW